MKLSFGESLPASGVDLFGDSRLEVVIYAKEDNETPADDVSLAEDGIIDVNIKAASLTREDIVAALVRVNKKMGTDYELAA